jgi:hypothetical protein
MKKIMANSGDDITRQARWSAEAREKCDLPCKAERWGLVCRIFRHPRMALCIFAIAASLVYSGCTGTAGLQPPTTQELDLTNRLIPIVDSGLHSTNLERNLGVIRSGLRRDALVLIAPVSVRASLQGVAGQRMLEGWATQVFNVGDGLQMNLFLRGPGGRRFAGGRYFDAGRKFEDREWIPIAFPLDLGQYDQLEIEIGAGLQGNLAADWLALSSLRLTQRKTTP